ncbi:GTPase HflX [Actinomycetaceae bacterium WB03_NA08]|uniref:GTPase HflX n=1 Tax=Scrofimicrobium canadense TaxID=2652290 RepID=A0A6N7W625_9ACTO|nr:GTPase HflX [Scrofimicrobium canadense]MSS83598.1 GTPase HflX [Scrofimicrobium canadense]
MNTADDSRAREIARRVLARQAGREPIAEEAGALEREFREGTRRRAIHGAELEEIGEVEYRQVRLEKVILVGLRTGGAAAAERSIEELEALAHTAGSEVLGSFLQTRDKPDPATYLGKGKAKELAEVVREQGADTVIVDGELNPSQRRGLEDAVGVKVVDRTTVILDIFAQHAKSREGKAQVELAQLEYLLPRLRGWGESMSRQAGGRVAAGAGIGSRGPGETKIELDRRRIRIRMARLRRQIAQMAPARHQQRASRRRGNIPSVAIAGYTNAGKSTLMNVLTDGDLLVEDALFATLDPTVRRTTTADGRVYTLTDTVGFVSNLPTELVEAFRSTLEEIAESDVIVHVVDASDPDPVNQVRAVNEVLSGIDGAAQIPTILVLNKVDVADPGTLAAVRVSLPAALEVSARTGAGIEALQEEIAACLPRPQIMVDVMLPFSEGALLSEVHEDGEILEQEWSEDGVRLVARVGEGLAARLGEANIAS